MEWIKCSERLPEEGSRALIFVYEAIVVAEYLPNYLPEVGFTWRLAEYSAVGWEADAVTHWMPLPEGPPAGIPLIAENISFQGGFAESLEDKKQGSVSFDLKWPGPAREEPKIEGAEYQILESRLMLDPSVRALLSERWETEDLFIERCEELIRYNNADFQPDGTVRDLADCTDELAESLVRLKNLRALFVRYVLHIKKCENGEDGVALLSEEDKTELRRISAEASKLY